MKKLSEFFLIFRSYFLLFLAAFILSGLTVNPSLAGALDKTGTLWSPHIEWNFENPTYSGNPFDLIASATFTHTASGATHTTEMFYDNANTWKFRFTATKTGAWSFTTSSNDPDLDGKSGTVTITSNPNTEIKGFLQSHGNKFARQIGENGELEGFLFNVYMDNNAFPHNGNLALYSDVNFINAYIQDAQQYGFNTIFLPVNNEWFKLGANRYTDHSSENPDIQTFEILEQIITTAHSQGVNFHMWAWGDESRKWTPIGVGGINGIPDRRLQRYIAARLGPLPGWTMGYGFDLQEWVSESQVGEWAQYMKARMGWQHLLMARGRVHAELDVKSYSGLKAHSYEEAVSNMNSDSSRPHFFEERDLYTRFGNTMDVTRQHLWQYTLAGGHGGFWGILWNGGPLYPNPEQLLTFDQFWKNRFLLNMGRANNLTDGYGLKTPDNTNYVFYKENTNSIQMLLSGMSGSQPAIAIDTKKAYKIVSLGMLSASNQIWTAPYISDWAIGVGDFEVDIIAPIAPSNLIVE